MSVETQTSGLFKKFEDYLQKNDGRARPAELVEIVENHLIRGERRRNLGG